MVLLCDKSICIIFYRVIFLGNKSFIKRSMTEFVNFHVPLMEQSVTTENMQKILRCIRAGIKVPIIHLSF